MLFLLSILAIFIMLCSEKRIAEASKRHRLLSNFLFNSLISVLHFSISNTFGFISFFNLFFSQKNANNWTLHARHLSFENRITVYLHWLCDSRKKKKREIFDYTTVITIIIPDAENHSLFSFSGLWFMAYWSIDWLIGSMFDPSLSRYLTAVAFFLIFISILNI